MVSGLRLTVLDAPSYVTTTATGVLLPWALSRTVPVVTEIGSMSSENTALTVAATSTSVAPSAGVTLVTVGAVWSITHVVPAGVGSTLPERSMARTWKLWRPAVSPWYAWGAVQALNPAPS